MMKKILGIVIVGLLLSSNVYGATLETIKKPSDKYVKDYVSKMSVADIIAMDPGALQNITANEGGVQYHFFMRMKGISGSIPIICFISIKSTACRVP